MGYKRAEQYIIFHALQIYYENYSTCQYRVPTENLNYTIFKVLKVYMETARSS